MGLVFHNGALNSCFCRRISDSSSSSRSSSNSKNSRRISDGELLNCKTAVNHDLALAHGRLSDLNLLQWVYAPFAKLDKDVPEYRKSHSDYQRMVQKAQDGQPAGFVQTILMTQLEELGK